MLEIEDKITILNYLRQGIIISGVTFAEHTLIADTNELLIRLGFCTGDVICAAVNEANEMFLLDEYEWLAAGGLQVLAKLHGIKDVELEE